MLVSVITVVYNDKLNILATLDSVIAQKYKNIEYIIIDGASNDGTRELILDKIKEISKVNIQKVEDLSIYLESSLNENFSFKFLSQKDSGIYDAMNKGINLASGEWCNFMNSGDRFYNTDSIKNLFLKYFDFIDKGGAQCDVIYGDTWYELEKGRGKIPKNNANPNYRMPFCHQSAFVKTDILKQYKFDTSFRILADNDFFTKIYRKGLGFLYIDEIVSCYDTHGFSSNLNLAFLKEELKIAQKFNRFYAPILIFKYLIALLKTRIKTALPTRLSLFLQERYNTKT